MDEIVSMTTYRDFVLIVTKGGALYRLYWNDLLNTFQIVFETRITEVGR